MTPLCPALMISAPASGQGKTSLTAALAWHFRQQGLRVRVFKTGPDFLDPQILQVASAAPVYQLDPWMLGQDECCRLLHQAATTADLILIEGVMGLFDGSPSSADLARLFNLPILLLIDARAMAQTFGALALGMSQYQNDLSFFGVFANQVGSPSHASLLQQSLPNGLTWQGYWPRNPSFSLPERDLGLVSAAEIPDLEQRLQRLAQALPAEFPLPAAVAFPAQLHNSPAVTYDEDLVLFDDELPLDDLEFARPDELVLASLAQPEPSPDELSSDSARTQAKAGPLSNDSALTQAKAGPLSGIRIGIARDAAFCFIYQANLDCLQQLGAHLQFFSPLTDTELPAVDALYLPGGYPELHLTKLAANGSMLTSIRQHHQQGRAIWAECGGLLYLLEFMINKQGEQARLVGLLPGHAVMQSRLQALGLQQLDFAQGSLRGHSFHYSWLEVALEPWLQASNPNQGNTREVLYRQGQLLATYIHSYFPSNPALVAQIFRGELT